MSNSERVVYLICLAMGLTGWVFCAYLAAKVAMPPKKPRIVVNACSGCGTEWHSYEGTRTTPLKKCPNCPMSDEEFEALKEAIRNRHKGDER